jgi:hypothetical protein
LKTLALAKSHSKKKKKKQKRCWPGLKALLAIAAALPVSQQHRELQRYRHCSSAPSHRYSSELQHAADSP